MLKNVFGFAAAQRAPDSGRLAAQFKFRTGQPRGFGITTVWLKAVGVAGITFVLRRTGTACFRSAKHSRQVQDVYEQMRSSGCHISTQESSWLYALSILSGKCAFVCLRNTRRVVQQAS